MGWTELYKPKGRSLKDFFAAQFNYERNGEKISVIDCCAHWNQEAYLALERTKDGFREVFAVVCLIRYQENAYYNFRYKKMDEQMHPFYYNCPKRILDQLTPTDNKYANEWRKNCWKFQQDKN